MEKISEQIIVVINDIAQRLGVATDKLYPILKKQALIEGLLGAFWVLIALTTLFIIYKLTKYFYFTYDKEGDSKSYYWDEEHTAFVLVSFTFTVISLFIINFNFKNTLIALFNPDWYIINDILMKIIK